MRILILILFLLNFCAKANVYNINTDFFTRFNDECFEKYIFQALSNNHDLKSINEKIKQYRYEISNSLSNELPKLSVGSNYLGAKFPTGDTNFLIKRNSYVLPVIASYEPDFLLKNRDKTRSAKKIYEAELSKQKASYISLLGDVANGYINILLFDFLIKKQEEIVKNVSKNLVFNKQKFNYGVIDLINLSKEKEAVEIQKVLLNTFIKQRNQLLYNFATLISISPNCIEDIKRKTLEEFEYQKEIPKEIPYETLSNRPDLIELEKRLKSAKIDITVAKKDFFPSFNITAALVFDTAGGGNFFSWNSSFAYLIAGLTQDIFKGGAKIANLKIKKARFMELLEKYKQTDLNAIKEVNNSLNLILEDTKSNESLKKQVAFEKERFFATRKKYLAGSASVIDYLEDKNSLLQQEQLLGNSKATRLMDYITLYKALGGELWRKKFWLL